MYEKTPEKEQEGYDDTYLRNRIEKLEKRVRIIIAILIDKGFVGEELGKRIEESKQSDDGLLKWLDNELKQNVETYIEEALWIQKAGVKKGALRSQLGIKEDEKIPISFLQKVAKAEVGTTLSFKGKDIKVTAKLKRRVLLAIKFRKMKK